MEKFHRFLDQKNKVIAATALGIGAFVMSGCGALEQNYSGEGNEFTIRGPILDVGDNSVKIMPLEILEVNGKSESWFETDDETRVHDNYKNSGCDQKEVGVIYDQFGTGENLDDLQAGEWVEITGKIRESKSSCGKTQAWNWRPVFDVVREIPGR
jgi:hypothetical protein